MRFGIVELEIEREGSAMDAGRLLPVRDEVVPVPVRGRRPWSADIACVFMKGTGGLRGGGDNGRLADGDNGRLDDGGRFARLAEA